MFRRTARIRNLPGAPAYSTGRVVRIPVQPKTVGDHIRLKRLGLKLFQRDVAKELGVDTTAYQMQRAVTKL